ncbi:MAG: hypothetical protein K0S92_40 [Desertimonas sp.]|nr:hypothetical protein [Desertimonas sp.]
MTADPTAFVLGGRGGLRRRDLRALRTWAGLAIVAVLVVIPLRGLYRFTGGTMEEGFMLYFPERMAKGDVPNVDFLHLYGPGSLHVLMAWYELFGHTLAVERTFGLLQHVAIILALFTLARPWGRAAATLDGGFAVFFVLTPIGLTAMAWNGGLALTLWSAVFAIRSTTVDGRPELLARLAAGLLGGLALTYRPDLVVAVALILGWMIWTRRSSWRAAAAGVLVGLSPLWYHLAVAGPRAAWQGMVVDPVVHLRNGRELPRPPSWDRLDGALQAIAESQPPWWDVPHLGASQMIFVWFLATLVGTVGLLVLAVAERRRGRRDGRATVLLVVALVSLSILPQALQRPDSTHLTWVTCVSWPFAVVAVADLVQQRWPRTTMRRAAAAGAVFTLVVTFVVTSLFTFRHYVLHTRAGYGWVPSTFEVSRDDRNFYFGAPRAALASQQVIDDLDGLARPGDRLFVGPMDLSRTWYSDAVFYWLFPEMEPATYFVEMDPGLANAADSGLADDLASADFVVLTSFWDGWREPNTSMEFGSQAPNEVLDRQFCQYRAYEDGLVRLYYRCR